MIAAATHEMVRIIWAMAAKRLEYDERICGNRKIAVKGIVAATALAYYSRHRSISHYPTVISAPNCLVYPARTVARAVEISTETVGA